jgi:hypothetical protein
MTTAQVCALARCTPAKLWRRIDAGHMPKPVGHDAEGELFNRASVLIALGKFDHEQMSDQAAWDFDPGAVDAAQSRRPVRAAQGVTTRRKLLPMPLEGQLFILRSKPQTTATSGYSRSSQS